MLEELQDLARKLNASLCHIPRAANEVADILVKEGLARQTLFISYVNGFL